MNTTNNDIDVVEIQIKTAKEMINIKEALERLYKNKDFQLVINKEYFEKEAARLVRLRADMNLNATQRENVLRSIDGIGCLAQYFETIHQRASMMEQCIKDDEKAKEEMCKEELTNE